MSEAIGIPRVRQALAETAGGVRETVLREGAFTLAWRWLAGVAALAVLDLLVGLPAWLRWLALAGQVGFLLWSLWALRARQKRLGGGDEWAARVVEERHPEVDNALINAVQFERSLRGLPPVQASLIRRELSRAESTAAGIAAGDSVDREGERRALKVVLLSAGGWLLAVLLIPAMLASVLPRLFAPWMDEHTPPFSFTRYEVRPPGATVRYGESVAVSVLVSGPIPDSIALMTKSGKGGWNRTALDSEDPGKYSVTLDSLREDTAYYVQGSGSRSSQYRIHVVRPPVVKTLQVTYTYPAYTKKEPASEKLGEEGLHGLVNTRAAVRIESNRALDGGYVEVKTGEGAPQRAPVQVDPKDSSRGVAEVTLTRAGTYRLSLAADDGQVNEEAAKGKIRIDKDERPSVWINHPGQDLLVTPSMKVPIQVEAEDDHGIQRVEVHRIVNDLGDTPRDFPEPAQLPRTQHTLTMDMADLGVRPGDEIKYYAAAYDNDPGKPNMGETDPYTIKVVSPEEFQQALKQERQAQDLSRESKDLTSAVQDLAARQQDLAQKMEQLERQLQKNPGDRSLQKKLDAARKEQKALQEEARKLAELMRQYAQSPSASEIERSLKQKLGEMSQQMSRTANGSMQSAQGGNPSEAASEAREASRQLQQLNRRMQDQVAKSIDHLEKMLPLYNDMERFKGLLDQQGQLVLKAREFQQKNGNSKSDRAKMERLAEEQSRIQQELKQLQQDMNQHAEDAKEQFPKASRSAQKIAEEIGKRQIPGLMQGGKDGFRQSEGAQAFEKSQQALQQMQAMVQQCESSQGSQGFEGELDVALTKSLGQKGLGRSLNQLAAGMGMKPGSEQGTSGMGIGAGGMPGRESGQQGGYAMRGPRAYVPATESVRSGGGGGSRERKPTRIAGQPAGPAPEDVEVVKDPAQLPPKAPGADGSRYPAEYRRLISDYFKSVAERK